MTPFIRLRINRMKGVISVKKRLIPLVFVLALLLAVPAYAASPRVITILPAISFDDTTANCRVSVSANHGTDRVERTLLFGMVPPVLQTGMHLEQDICYSVIQLRLQEVEPMN